MSTSIKYWSGNLVQYKDLPTIKPERRGKIVPLTFDDLLAIEEGHDVIEPILLTGEWLNKFGFKTDLITYWKEGETPFEVGIYANLSIGFLPTGQISIAGPWIRYVHELQNLYYSWTGKELKIVETDESAQ